MEIYSMRQGHERWDETIAFAQKSEWSAGPYLAKMMRENRFLDWERVFAAFEDGQPVGYCDFTEYDEMPKENGFSPFIGFVYVDKAHRGHRISEKLIARAVDYARELGYSRVYIMSGEHGLYEKYGFEKIGEYKTIYGDVDGLFVLPLSGE